jgi:transposase
MFIKKSSKTVNGKKYVNHLLVESYSTPKGPRHKVICSLGNLDPGPKDKWLGSARNIKTALGGQLLIEPDPVAEQIVDKIRSKNNMAVAPVSANVDERWLTVDTKEFSMSEAREAGPVHVGHQMWEKLQISEVLTEAGLSQKACLLTELMTINRLVEPSSELATVEWVGRTALPDILGEGAHIQSPTALYKNMDQLHPQRTKIETALAEKERKLFNLDDAVLLYDLTSTYFEGQSEKNPKAAHGYSRDHRPDCKQLVVGLVVNGDGFPKAHEVFAGNRNDGTTVDEMLTALDQRIGRAQEETIEKSGRVPTVVVDRGMASDENLAQIKARHYHYVVAARHNERDKFLPEFEEQTGWRDVVRKPSQTNPYQLKSKLRVKRKQQGDETMVLCISDERIEKDKAIRSKQETRLRADLVKLEKRVSEGRLKESNKIHEAIGRLKERYTRVARYYRMNFDENTRVFSWSEDTEKKARASELDGAYLLKTDRDDLTEEEIWKLYSLLTRIEAAFRDIKGPLSERPIFHQTEARVETHIFICILAYHLLVAIEKMFRDAGVYTSWESVRKDLTTHQVVTATFPTKSGRELKIRKSTKPEAVHCAIYNILQITENVMKPVRTWHTPDTPVPSGQQH